MIACSAGFLPGANGISLPQATNPLRGDYNHIGPATLAAIDGGNMDGFPSRSYVQYTQAAIPTYWAYAQQFGLGDNFFSSMATIGNHTFSFVFSETDGNAKEQTTGIAQRRWRYYFCYPVPGSTLYSVKYV